MSARAESIARRVALLILALSFAFSACKAATAAITYDEAYTYLRFAGQRSSHILKDYHLPNNHILHTLLVHYTTRIFGDSLLAIRLPALGGAALFLVSLWRTGRFLPRPLGILWPICTALTPALIDFNALARGYSLGYGFCFAAVAVLAPTLVTTFRLGRFKLTWLVRPLVAGMLVGLAIACVPVFALFAIGFIGGCLLLGLWPFRLMPPARAASSSAAILFGGVASSWYYYARIRPDPKQWPVGYSDLVALFRDFLIRVHGAPESLSNSAALIVLTLVGALTVAGLYLARRRREPLPAILVLTFALMWLGLAMMRILFRMNLPYPRAILFMAPSMVFAILYPVGMAFRNRGAASDIACGLIIVVFVILCVRRLDPRAFFEWRSNAGIPNAVSAIDLHRGQKQHVILSTPSEAYLNICVEYLIKHRNLHWLEIIDGPEGDFLLDRSGANAEAWPGRTIFADQASDIVVRERLPADPSSIR